MAEHDTPSADPNDATPPPAPEYGGSRERLKRAIRTARTGTHTVGSARALERVARLLQDEARSPIGGELANDLAEALEWIHRQRTELETEVTRARRRPFGFR